MSRSNFSRTAALLLVLTMSAACSSSATTGVGPASSTSSASPTTPGTPSVTATPCDTGSPLPSGSYRTVDYIDFVKVAGTTFVAEFEPRPTTTRADLSAVVTTVLCRMTDIGDDHAAPEGGDRSAAFLAPGTEIRAVSGFAPTCRLAAVDENGELHVYLAQRKNVRVATPEPCAVRATPDSAP